jgi:hypothetical protein
MSDEQGEWVGTQVLWVLQVQPENSESWVNFGTYLGDPKRILLGYDYRREAYPDERLRIGKSVIHDYVEDTEKLRETLAQKENEGPRTGLQSE